MDNVIQNFLAKVTSLHELNAENLPDDVLASMSKMKPKELYKACMQFVVLQNNVPTRDKLLNIAEDELLFMVDEYGKKLLNRLK